MLSFESPIRTPWHSVPVVFKFVAVCVCSLLLFIFDDFWVQLSALVCVVALYRVGGLAFLHAGFLRIKFLWLILLFIILVHAFTGTVAQGFGIALRLISIVALSNLMTMTSRLSDLLAMLHGALSPLRALNINTRPVELAIALVIRFTPVLINKSASILSSWRMRSAKRPGWRIVFPISLAAIDDAEQVAQALKARGGTTEVKSN